MGIKYICVWFKYVLFIIYYFMGVLFSWIEYILFYMIYLSLCEIFRNYILLIMDIVFIELIWVFFYICDVNLKEIFKYILIFLYFFIKFIFYFNGINDLRLFCR